MKMARFNNFLLLATIALTLFCVGDAQVGPLSDVTVPAWLDQTITKGGWNFYEVHFQEYTHSVKIDVSVLLSSASPPDASVTVYVDVKDVPSELLSEHVMYSRTRDSNLTATIEGAANATMLVGFDILKTGDAKSVYIGIYGESDFARYEVSAVTQNFETARSNLLDSGPESGVIDPFTSATVTYTDIDGDGDGDEYKFFEFYFADATNDMDVMVVVDSATTVDIYVSHTNKYPSHLTEFWMTTDSNQKDYYLEGADQIPRWQGAPAEDSFKSSVSGTTKIVVGTVEPWQAFNTQEGLGNGRRVFVGIRGVAASSFSIGARAYRYQPESARLEPGSVYEPGPASFQSTVATYNLIDSPWAGTEDARYSTVISDNFHYYQVYTSPNAFALDLSVTIHPAYAVPSSLACTSDSDCFNGGVCDNVATAGSPGPTNVCICAYGYGGDNCNTLLPTGAVYVYLRYDAFPSQGTYDSVYGPITTNSTITLTYDNLEPSLTLYVGVFGAAPYSDFVAMVNSSGTVYELVVTEETFTPAEDLEAGDSADVVTSTEAYHFYRLFVGTPDITAPTKVGHLERLDASVNFDGYQYSEQWVQTWTDSQRDVNDVDVKVTISVAVVSNAGTISVYGSTEEMYPSEYRCKGSTACAQSLGLTHSDGVNTLDIEVFTFLHNSLYVGIRADAAIEYNVTWNWEELNAGMTTPVIEKWADATAKGLDLCSDNNYCSDHGSCVARKCYCIIGWVGDACEIPAFGTREHLASADGAPAINMTLYPSPLDYDAPVVVDYEINFLPDNGRVLVYVDAVPYPRWGSNVLYENYHDLDLGGGNYTGNVTLWALTRGPHTVEMIVVDSTGYPLASSFLDFEVSAPGGCLNDCNDHGVCHTGDQRFAADGSGEIVFDGENAYGYCICDDGWTGVACDVVNDQYSTNVTMFELDGVTPIVPGAGFFSNVRRILEHKLQKAITSSAILQKGLRTLIDEATTAAVEAVESAKAALDAARLSNAELLAGIEDTIYNRAVELRRDRDRVSSSLDQEREHIRRLTTRNLELYLDSVRLLHENQNRLQNHLADLVKAHEETMANKADEHLALKTLNDFKINVLKTANGRLTDIAELKDEVCELLPGTGLHDCYQVDVVDKYTTGPGYRHFDNIKDLVGAGILDENKFGWLNYTFMTSPNVYADDLDSWGYNVTQGATWAPSNDSTLGVRPRWGHRTWMALPIIAVPVNDGTTAGDVLGGELDPLYFVAADGSVQSRIDASGSTDMIYDPEDTLIHTTTFLGGNYRGGCPKDADGNVIDPNCNEVYQSGEWTDSWYDAVPR